MGPEGTQLLSAVLWEEARAPTNLFYQIYDYLKNLFENNKKI